MATSDVEAPVVSEKPPTTSIFNMLSASKRSEQLGIHSTPLIPEGTQRSLGTDSQWVGDADLKRQAERRRNEAQSFWSTLLLAYQSLGVVYGDLGTSPLYVFSTAFSEHELSSDGAVGALSVIFWTFTIIVIIKYVNIVMRADDNGEGGTFAVYTLLCRHIGLTPTGAMNSADHQQLLAIKSVNRPAQTRSRFLHSVAGAHVRRWLRRSPKAQVALMVVVIYGTALVLADGVITPAISVMSAVSGLTQASNKITDTTIVGVSIGILLALFLMQSVGTRRVAFTFAPIVALWLVTNAGMGIFNLHTYGVGILRAVSPHYIYFYFRDYGRHAWVSLGGLMLCITGTEALFADMGHFNRYAINTGATLFVYPAIMLQYAGQSAYLSKFPQDVGNAYYAAVPKSIFWPVLILATLAAITASQALITGAFSIIRQSMSIGLFPKLQVIHTADDREGQIYIAEVNYTLMVLCVAVIAGFQDTAQLGNAYGVAVMAVMLITTFLVSLVALVVWELHPLLVLPAFVFLFTIESFYWSSTLLKVPHGGWFTLAVATAVVAVKLTWWAGNLKKRGGVKNKAGLQDLLHVDCSSAGAPVLYLADTPKQPLSRPCGLGIYYADSTTGTPTVLAHLVANMNCVQEVVVIMTVRFLPLPQVTLEDRLLLRVVPALPNFYQVVARYGYLETVDHGQEFVRLMVSRIVRFLSAMQESSSNPMASLIVRRNAMRPLAAASSAAMRHTTTSPLTFQVPHPSLVDSSDYDGRDSQDGGSLCDVDEVDQQADNPAAAGALGTAATDDVEGAQLPQPQRSVLPLVLVVNAHDAVRTHVGALHKGRGGPGGSVMADGMQEACRFQQSDLAAGAGAATGEQTLVAVAATLEDPNARVLLEAASFGVVYYAAKVTLRVSQSSNAIKRLFYNQCFGMMDRNSWTDREAWAIPTNKLVALDVVHHIDE